MADRPTGPAAPTRWPRPRKGLPLIVPPGPTIVIDIETGGVRMRPEFEPHETGGTRLPPRPFVKRGKGG